jgi:hypothetical protein
MSERQDIGVLASFLVAALAGVGNQLITMPASVVATRMQVGDGGTVSLTFHLQCCSIAER